MLQGSILARGQVAGWESGEIWKGVLYYGIVVIVVQHEFHRAVVIVVIVLIPSPSRPEFTD
jgi:hypothetical protein